jgi:cytochrome c-type biogenesis protein CcmF
LFSFAWVIRRLPLLRPRYDLDSWLSREAAFVANNWILLIAAMLVMFGTMFPTMSEALTGNRLTVGPPFFNRWMTPLGLILLLLTGIAPLLAWRRTTLANLRDQFLWPAAFMAVVTAAFVGLGVRVWSSGICFALCAFVAASISQEFVRGARVRKAATGTDLLTAGIGLVMRERRRYGGYIVHLGIVLMYLGFAGEGFKTDQQILLKLGQEATVRHYTVKNNGVKVSDDGQKEMVTGHIVVSEDSKPLGTMYPARWFYRKHEEQPTTEVAIRRTPAEDLYLVMPAYELEDQSMSLQVVISPLVNWIWAGFGVLMLGTGIALLPERAFAFALGRVPAEAGTM